VEEAEWGESDVTRDIMRIVLDTSVLVAGLRSEHGGSAAVLGQIFAGSLVPLMNYNIAAEYRHVVTRPFHLTASGLTQQQALEFIELLEERAESIQSFFKHRPLSADPTDDHLLDVAINGNAEAIVTHNERHFRGAEQFGVEVLSPGELLLRMKERGIFRESKD
jgi:putative PIN family toxin of toxin-antitoxin system